MVRIYGEREPDLVCNGDNSIAVQPKIFRLNHFFLVIGFKSLALCLAISLFTILDNSDLLIKLLYRLFRRHQHRTMLLIMNAVFLILFCGFMFMCIFIDSLRPVIEIFLSPGLVAIEIIAFLGNTAVMTIALAFIYRSVEKHYRSVLSEPLQPVHGTADQAAPTVQ